MKEGVEKKVSVTYKVVKYHFRNCHGLSIETKYFDTSFLWCNVLGFSLHHTYIHAYI